MSDNRLAEYIFTTFGSQPYWQDSQIENFGTWLGKRRPITTIVSDKEKEFIKYALLLGYNYLCRDEECYITLYENEPIRLPSDIRTHSKAQWVFENNCDSGNFTIVDEENFNLFDWVKWETGILNLNTLEITDELEDSK